MAADPYSVGVGGWCGTEAVWLCGLVAGRKTSARTLWPQIRQSSAMVDRGYRAALKASHGVKRSTVMAGLRRLTNRTRCSPGPA
jgi:hypothetical protein